MEHQDVGLLEDLRALDALRSEQEVGGDRPAGRELGDDERLELAEPGELLVDARARVVAVDECVGEPAARRRARPAPSR